MSAQTPTTILSQLPITIISAAGQLVIICLVLLGSHSQTSSDSINYLNNGPVITDADNFETFDLNESLKSIQSAENTPQPLTILLLKQSKAQIKWSHYELWTYIHALLWKCIRHLHVWLQRQQNILTILASPDKHCQKLKLKKIRCWGCWTMFSFLKQLNQWSDGKPMRNYVFVITLWFNFFSTRVADFT